MQHAFISNSIGRSSNTLAMHHGLSGITTTKRRLLLLLPTESMTNLNKHLCTVAELSRFERIAVWAHRLAITWKLEHAVSPPHRLDVLITHRANLLPTQARLVHSKNVHLLDQHRQRRFRSFAHLLVSILCLKLRQTEHCQIRAAFQMKS